MHSYDSQANRLLLNYLMNEELSIKDFDLGEAKLIKFLEYAEKNRTLYRVLQKLQDDGIEYEYQKNLIKEKTRYAQRKYLFGVELIQKVCKNFSNKNIPHVIFKTIEDFPDIGDDIDVLIPEENLSEARTCLDTMAPASVEKGLYGLEYKKKVHYTFKKKDISIEIELYPKFTSMGETYLPAKEITARAVTSTFEGVTFKTPVLEDRFLLTVIHSMYRHGGLIRIVDVINTIELLSNNKMDWDFVLDEAERSGIISGLLLFLSIIEQVNRKYEGNADLPPFITEMDPPLSSIPAEGIPFRISSRRLLTNFCGKFLRDLLNLRIYSAFRVAHTCYIHSIGRLLILLCNIGNSTSLLDKLGLSLYREM